MIIGTFNYDRDADRYHGSIATLSLSCDAVEFRAEAPANEREPSYRVVLASPHGDTELGAAWRRRTDRGQDYLSVSLDDPSLDHALSAALFTDRDGKASLVWSRPPRPAAAPDARPKRSGRCAGERPPARGLSQS